MSTQDCETSVLNELKASSSKSLTFSALLKKLSKSSPDSRAELTETLLAVIRRLIYRGKISITKGSKLEELTESTFQI
jgi:hypothetical protein